MIPAAANATAGLLGLFIFMSVFLFVIYTLLRRGAREEAKSNAAIPFKED